MVGRVGLEPTMPEGHGFTARCVTNSAHRPICWLFIVLSPHFLIHDVKILLHLLLIKLSFLLTSTSTTTHLILTGQQRPSLRVDKVGFAPTKLK